MSVAAPQQMSARDRARLSPIGLAHLASEGRWQARHLHQFLNTVYMMMAAAATAKNVIDSPWRRVIISVPPRHGKSDIFSLYGPAWFMGHFPHLNVGIVSYEATFAESFGRKTRNVMEYLGPQVFDVNVDPRSAAADWWSTVEANNTKHVLGGSLRAFGIGGPAMGKGFNLLSIDDPLKNAQEALSRTIRDSHWDWWQTAAKTRLEPGGAVAVVMQRWHEDDLAGRAMREEGLYSQGGAWTPIVLPLRAEPITYRHAPGLTENLPDPLGREPGAYLWPGRYTDKELAEKERTTPAFWWAAQYQQRPALPEGALFARESFRYFQDLGDVYRVARQDGPVEIVPVNRVRKFFTVDLAASIKTRADFTVIGVWGITPSGRLLLLDVIRKKMEGPEQEQVLQTRFHLEEHVREVHVEAVSYQLAFVQRMRRTGMPIREYNPGKDDKYSRALFASARFAGEGVFFLQGAPWLRPLEDELLGFPFNLGQHDDQVDMISMACIVTGSQKPLSIRLIE